MFMSNNKLAGSIPFSWDALAYNLSVLDLSENQLTGQFSSLLKGFEEDWKARVFCLPL